MVRKLKSNKISALSAVTRKRNELTELMNDVNNLHLVKTGEDSLRTLFEQYQNRHNVSE